MRLITDTDTGPGKKRTTRQYLPTPNNPLKEALAISKANY